MVYQSTPQPACVTREADLKGGRADGWHFCEVVVGVIFLILLVPIGLSVIEPTSAASQGEEEP